jgi:hypothetical protein
MQCARSLKLDISFCCIFPKGYPHAIPFHAYMAEPLTIKRPEVAPMRFQVIAGILLLGPLAGLLYCVHTGRPVHTPNPLLNLTVYLSIFIIPLIWASFICYPRLQFKESDEVVLGTCSTIQKFLYDWWMMFAMWAAPVFGLLAGTHWVLTYCLPHREDLSMSPAHAFLVMVVMLCLGLFYSTVLFGHNESKTRLAPEGLRMSLARFHAWTDIDHASEHDNVYVIYHRANPALPANVLKVSNEENRNLLLHAMAVHKIPVSNTVASQLIVVKVAVIVGFIILLAGAEWLHKHTALSNLWITVIIFGGGILFTLVLERYRGVQKYTKCKPIFAPTPDAGDDQAIVELK